MQKKKGRRDKSATCEKVRQRDDIVIPFRDDYKVSSVMIKKKKNCPRTSWTVQFVMSGYEGLETRPLCFQMQGCMNV